MTYINPQTVEPVAQLIAHYRMQPLQGYALRTPQGQAVMAAVKIINPQYDETQYATKNAARKAFANGPQGNTARSLSVAMNHLDQLSEAAEALAQHDTPAFNRVANDFGQHVTGANPQTNFEAMTEIVGDEIVKAVVGTSGGEGDRDAIKEAFNPSRSPAQLNGAISRYEGLMDGQLRGLRRQYKRATHLDDFDSILSPVALNQLNGAGGTSAASRVLTYNPATGKIQ